MRGQYCSCGIALVLGTLPACHVLPEPAHAGTAGIEIYSFVSQGRMEPINSLPGKRFDHDGDDATTSPVRKRVAQLVEVKPAVIPAPRFEPAGGTPSAIGSDAPPVRPRPSDIISASDVDRAEALIKIGDLSGARLLLTRPADLGDARALLLLARTYDPKYLPEKRYGIQSDEAKATELYGRAAAANMQAETANPPSQPATAEPAPPLKPETAITQTKSDAIAVIQGKAATEVLGNEKEYSAPSKDLLGERHFENNDSRSQISNEGSFRDEPARLLPVTTNTSGSGREPPEVEAIPVDLQQKPDLTEDPPTLMAKSKPLASSLAGTISQPSTADQQKAGLIEETTVLGANSKPVAPSGETNARGLIALMEVPQKLDFTEEETLTPGANWKPVAPSSAGTDAQPWTALQQKPALDEAPMLVANSKRPDTPVTGTDSSDSSEGRKADLTEEALGLDTQPLASASVRSVAMAPLDLGREERGGAKNGGQQAQKEETSQSGRYEKPLPKVFFPDGAQIFSLLSATNSPASEPQTMPSEVVALEPMLSNFRYLKRPDGEVALVGLFTNAIFGVVNRENVPLRANRSSSVLHDGSRR